jgi:aminoglycoside phosphotransferase (APT) family kinase protein
MSTTLIDQPKAVRDEDRLDLGAIVAWLKAFRPDLADLPEQRQFRGGASNLTYLLTWPDTALVLRTAPKGTKARGAHDMGREVRVLTGLSGHYPVPRVVAHCTDDSVIGREFYLMERLEGLILRQDVPAELALDEAGARGLCETWLDHLLALHQLDPATVGLTELGRGEGYVGRQVAGWSKRLRKARTPDAASFESVMSWLDDHQPADVATCLIHNDWRFDNLVLDPNSPTTVLGVLDWEMSTLGDPLMDLGGALAYWVQADDPIPMQLMRRQPTHLPGMPGRADLIARYLERSGLADRVPSFRFYEVFGLFRLAVILQQIYYRWYHKQTTNPVFESFGMMANFLEQRCIERMEAAA